MVGAGPASRPQAPILVLDASTRSARATRAELCREVQRRGWRLVELGRGDDYPEVDDAAAEHEADVVAFAGPDRSQSKAAVVAAGRELAYACVPAGGDDLFARDLGVDPDDVMGALGAIEDYCEYSVDLGEVNGVTFVNYVALGLDCRPVRAHRSAEPCSWAFATRASYVVACRRPALRLHWFASSRRKGCEALFVSNNRRRFYAHAVGGRTRLDGGVLGIGVLGVDRGSAAAPDCGGPWHELDLPAFEADSVAPLRADVDGQVVSLEPPLRFRILPRALRVRVPLHS